MKKIYGLYIAFSCLILIGCGQSGPLYLPVKNPPIVKTPADTQTVDQNASGAHNA